MDNDDNNAEMPTPSDIELLFLLALNQAVVKAIISTRLLVLLIIQALIVLLSMSSMNPLVKSKIITTIYQQILLKG
jgi:hypothetical protein